MLTIESAIAYSDYIDALKSLTSVAKMPYRRAIITTYFILYIVRRNIRRSLFTILFIDYRMVAFPLWLQTIKRFKNAFVKLLAKYRSLITREIRMRAGANQNHWRITYWIRLGAVGQSNPNRQRSVTMEIAKLRYTIGGDSSAVDWLVGWLVGGPYGPKATQLRLWMLTGRAIVSVSPFCYKLVTAIRFCCTSEGDNRTFTMLFANRPLIYMNNSIIIIIRSCSSTSNTNRAVVPAALVDRVCNGQFEGW